MNGYKWNLFNSIAKIRLVNSKVNLNKSGTIHYSVEEKNDNSIQSVPSFKC